MKRWGSDVAKKAKSRKTKRSMKKNMGGRKKAPALRKKSVARKARKMRIERKLEEGLIETFPGSDPVAVTDPTIVDKRE